MLKPTALQYLKRGQALVGKVFPRFVDTWNWLVEAFSSMTGDGDLNPEEGRIKIDRSNPARPIIRFDSDGAEGIKADKDFDLITDIRYNATTGTIQVKTRKAKVESGVVAKIEEESLWTDKIGTVPHSQDT